MKLLIFLPMAAAEWFSRLARANLSAAGKTKIRYSWMYCQ